MVPIVEGAERTPLKIGTTTKDAGMRAKTQAKHTAAPKKPLLLREYQSADLDPSSLDKRFHRLLRAAEHGHTLLVCDEGLPRVGALRYCRRTRAGKCLWYRQTSS